MFAKHTLNYVLFDEISLLLLPEVSLISVFLTAAMFFFVMHWAVYFLTIQSVAIFQDFAYVYHLRRRCLLLELYVFLLESFAQLP